MSQLFYIAKSLLIYANITCALVDRSDETESAPPLAKRSRTVYSRSCCECPLKISINVRLRVGVRISATARVMVRLWGGSHSFTRKFMGNVSYMALKSYQNRSIYHWYGTVEIWGSFLNEAFNVIQCGRWRNCKKCIDIFVQSFDRKFNFIIEYCIISYGHVPYTYLKASFIPMDMALKRPFYGSQSSVVL